MFWYVDLSLVCFHSSYLQKVHSDMLTFSLVCFHSSSSCALQKCRLSSLRCISLFFFRMVDDVFVKKNVYLLLVVYPHVIDADNVPANKPRNTTPANCQTSPTILPPLVTGDLSPYPTVVTVVLDHQIASKLLQEYLYKSFIGF